MSRDCDEATKVAKGMSENGSQLEFKNVTARYPLRVDIVLKKVDVVLEAGQHIAVVGRTGSGKSSLIFTLFRMMEIVDGAVLVDSQDIAKMDLCTHRSRLTIIPQARNYNLSFVRNPKTCVSVRRKSLYFRGP